MKYVCIALIVAASCALGTTFTRQEKQRMELIKRLMEFCLQLEAAMLGMGLSLMRVLLESDIEGFKSCALMMEQDPSLPIEATVKAAFLGQKNAGDNREAIGIAARLVGGVSRAKTAQQITHAVKITQEELARLLKEATEVRLKRAVTIRSVVVFAGIAMGIILI